MKPKQAIAILEKIKATRHRVGRERPVEGWPVAVDLATSCSCIKIKPDTYDAEYWVDEMLPCNCGLKRYNDDLSQIQALINSLVSKKMQPIFCMDERRLSFCIHQVEKEFPRNGRMLGAEWTGWGATTPVDLWNMFYIEFCKARNKPGAKSQPSLRMGKIMGIITQKLSHRMIPRQNGALYRLIEVLKEQREIEVNE